MKLTRRAFTASLLALATPLSAQNYGTPAPFSLENLLRLTREMAAKPYNAASSIRILPAITAEVYTAIKHKTPIDLGGFALEPLHQGLVFQTPTRLFIVDNGFSKEVLFNSDDFEGLPTKENGAFFSGFKLSKDNEEQLKFQAGTTFRAKALSQAFGVLSRALALNVGEATGEEFPRFTSFWFERGAQPTIHGLFESESVTGLASFKYDLSENTAIDVKITFTPRVDLNHVGFAPQTAMYLFGANDKANVDDYRGAVHETTGLSMLAGGGEWIYRTIHNPETLQFSSFLDANPKGFGLMQRERRFETYQDLEGAFERRPSVWVEPLGDWGEGQVQLVEIPSEAQANKNIIAYWKPKKVFAAKQEVSFAYRLNFCWSPPVESKLAEVVATRTGRGTQRRRRFIVDFAGETVNSLDKIATLTPMLSNHKGKLHAINMKFNPEIQGARVSFELEPDGNSSELRLTLEQDKKQFSETWLYRWTPP